MRVIRALVMSALVFAVPSGAAVATTTTQPPPPPPAPAGAPTYAPVSNGGVTVTVLGVHPSIAANAVVVVAEVTTEVELAGSSFAVLVTASGQQYETDAYFDITDTVFPGVSRVVAWSFNTPDPAGTVHWTAYDADYGDIDIELPIG